MPHCAELASKLTLDLALPRAARENNAARPHVLGVAEVHVLTALALSLLLRGESLA
jgi:hypothetical protein